MDLKALKTFRRGGVHPPEKKLTASCPVKVLPLPETVIIPATQHIGTPSEISVNKGEKVVTGQVIAKATGYISAHVHSSVSGKVSKIDTVADITGYKQTCIFIDVCGDEWMSNIDRSPDIIREIKYTPGEIIQKCLEAGVVGLGGATFPTHVKLKIPVGKKCNLLIINGVECEPYLTSDHRLMLEKGEEIIIGTRIMMKALGITHGIIGIENNKSDAIAHLRRLLNGADDIAVQSLKVKYPQGGEKQLIKALTGREVPSGGLPVDIGVVVQNVGTAFAVYEAVQKNKPLLERVVTITGTTLAKPGNYLVRIGTPVSKLIEAAGGLPEDTGKIISGGPMMGKALSNIQVPVVKGTSGIVIFPASESFRIPYGPCIRCSKCISACPMGLEPYLLMAMTEKGLFERARAERITDCMECGSCSYICPAHRPLLDWIRLGKATVMRITREKSMK
ncbi:MAG: electron transport complex subunit RsxC [Bacteroidales bacterium]